MSTVTQSYGFPNYQARLMCGDPVIVGYDKIVKLSKRWSVADPMLSPSFLVSQALYCIRQCERGLGKGTGRVKTTSYTAISEIGKLWDALEIHLGRSIPAAHRIHFFTLDRNHDQHDFSDVAKRRFWQSSEY